jgi:hypothetical protein
MDELLANPVIQTAVVPFFVALIAGAILNRFGWYWAGLTVVTGFVACAWLVMDLKLFPLSSTRKIVMLGLVAVVAGIVLDVYAGRRRFIPPVLFVSGIIAASWVIWPVLNRREGAEFWLLAIGASIYAGWLMMAMERLRDWPLRAGTAALSLGIGTGVSAVMGASALLGQLASSIGAASGAYLLLTLFVPKQPAGSLLTIPVALLCSLLAIAGYVYATLPWYVLPLLAIIPLLACVPLPEQKPTWIKIALLVSATLPAAIASIFVAWWIEGAPPI